MAMPVFFALSNGKIAASKMAITFAQVLRYVELESSFTRIGLLANNKCT